MPVLLLMTLFRLVANMLMLFVFRVSGSVGKDDVGRDLLVIKSDTPFAIFPR